MNKKIIIGILCSLLCGSAAIGTVSVLENRQNYTATAEAVWTNPEIESEYFLGAEFTLPDVEISVGGVTVDASVSLVFPDGSATRAEMVSLNQIGKYSLKYSAVIDGKPYSTQTDFYVKGSVFSYESETTAISYKTCKYASDPTQEYLTVSLSQGDTLTVNQLIDVSDISENESIFDMFITPSILGLANFNELYFMFTDSENPDVYLKVRLKRYEVVSGQGYFLCGGNGQQMKGMESGTGKLHVDNNYGTPAISLSFDGQKQDGSTVNVDEYGYSFRYDAEEKATYFADYYGTTTFIVDHDSTKYYEKLWRGFPSGKVSLSIWADSYVSGDAIFCLTYLRGVDLTAYDQPFSESEPPEITINTDYETMPLAKVGMGYAVPTATAIDEYDGICKVETDVWYNYATSNPILVDVKDGEFIPSKEGNYTIIYTSRDCYNNIQTKALTVRAVNEIDAIVIEPLSVEETEVELGAWVSVPTELSIKGGSGNKTVKISVSNGSESYEIIDGFRPETQGVWTVTYVVTDYIGLTATTAYTISTYLPNTPILIDEIVLPKVFISDSPYTIPELYANDYSSGSCQRKLCAIEVTDANGTVSYDSGCQITPVVAQNGDEVVIKYQYDGITFDSVAVPTILAWETIDGTKTLREQNYFSGEGFVAEASQSGVLITAEQENAEWTFANALICKELSVVLTSETSTFDGLEMTLSDASVAENVIRMCVMKEDGSIRFTVVGSDAELEVLYNFDAQDGKNLTLGYKDGYFTVNGIEIEVNKTVGGAAFSGFGLSKAYVSVRFINATQGASYKVGSINGNPFTNKIRDQVQPVINIFGTYGGSYALNSTYTINAATASDVLSPNVVFTITMRDPDGQIVKDVNGVALEKVDPSVEYQVILSKYGQYSIRYTAQEDSTFILRPNVYDFFCAVTVADRTKPEVNFNGDFVLNAKVGDILVIPDFTVSDNLSSEEEITVSKFVLNPNGALIRLKGESNSIKATYAGVYEFRILAVDKAGNQTFIRVQITVTE